MNRARAWSRSPALVVPLLVVLICVATVDSGIGGLQGQLVLSWSLTCVSHAWLFVIASQVARTANDRSTRWVWCGIAVAGLFYAVGDLVQLALLARGPVDLVTGLGSPVQIALVLVGTGVPLGAVLALNPHVGHRPRPPRARLVLDGAIVMITATVFGSYLVLPSAGSVSLMVWLGLLVGPGLFLSVAFGVLALWRSGNPPMLRPVAAVIVVAATIEAAAQGGAAVLTTSGHLSGFLLCTVVASALLPVAAILQRSTLGVGAVRRGTLRRPVITFIPYLAILATFALLVRVLLTPVSGVRYWAVVGGALLSALLVVLRQALVNVDNSRLVDKLDTTVSELHQLLGERDRLAVALRHAANHDPLTGLANRALLGTRLDAAIARLSERPGRITLLIVDLDAFKSVNDLHGHAAGDAVLVAVGRRIRGCVREVDLVVRLGGDEFAVLVEDLPDDDHELARRITEALAAPIALAEGITNAAGSIGVVTSDDPTRSAESILHAADLDMYRAKRARAGLIGLTEVFRRSATTGSPPPSAFTPGSGSRPPASAACDRVPRAPTTLPSPT
ncbi:diguanylate cyclase domain-containing protein [Pengzhenrongella phosphoraccumulans]|uniref:diguanylate cyclase domain-containing protein n=1 Tax=Pengzhenrongella phosphoraccumulans TaxID=3114394 RepID=UPI00388F2418